MTKKTSNNTQLTDITPATLDTLNIGPKIAEYEQLLREATEKKAEVQDIHDEIADLLAPFGFAFSDYYDASRLKVYQKPKISKEAEILSANVGSWISSLVTSSSADVFRKFIGDSAFKKLEEVSSHYRMPSNKNIDEAASEKLWVDYESLLKTYREKTKELRKVEEHIKNQKEYVSHIKDLADVARKAKTLAIV